MKFYVYEWFIPKTNEIFYVGKGCRNRYKVRKHNKAFEKFLKENECESRIIKTFDSEKAAFNYEYERINELWTIGQCKANVYKGGAGGTIAWWTKEMREKYSKTNVMKSQKQRNRMKINNPMKNVEVQNKVKAYKQIKVVINGVVFNSKKEVCLKYGVAYETIDNWLKKGVNSYGEKCHLYGKETKEYIGRYNKSSIKPITYKGKTYEAQKDLAEYLGVNQVTICSWVKRGFDPNGNPCRRIGDEKEYTFVKKKDNEQHKKTIKVNGIIYSSKSEAEKSLGLSKGFLAPYLKGARRNNNFVCEYVNQQPSHKNSENCIVEGSTTNE
jgi:hypothetical protein